MHFDWNCTEPKLLSVHPVITTLSRTWSNHKNAHALMHIIMIVYNYVICSVTMHVRIYAWSAVLLHVHKESKPRSIIDSLPWLVMSQSSYKNYCYSYTKKPSLSLLSIMSWSKSKVGCSGQQMHIMHVCILCLIINIVTHKESTSQEASLIVYHD